MQADGKEAIYKRGYTMDIVKACLLQWHNSWTQCVDFAAEHQGADIVETCKNLFYFLVKNVEYREDAPGHQWIKTPARLLSDGVGDCKSFSIFIASCLQCLGIDCVLRFASYDGSKEYSHVYPVAFDETGAPVIIDVVAFIQRKVPFGKEVKYIKKLDMKSTQISMLSGIAGGYSSGNYYAQNNSEKYAVEQGNYYGNIDIPGARVQFSEKMQDGAKLYNNYLAALISYLEAIFSIGNQDVYNQIQLYKHIKAACSSKYTAADLKTVAYVFAAHIQNGGYVPENLEDATSYYDNLQKNIIAEIDGYLLNNAQYTVKEELISLQKDFLTWFDNEITSRNIIKTGTIPVEVFLVMFRPSALYFLYAVTDSSLLNKTTSEKKGGALQQLTQLIENVSSIDIDTALLFTSAEIISQTGLTPEQFNAGLKTTSIGDVDWTSIFAGVTTAATSFATIWSSVKGNNNTNNYAPNRNDYVPDYGGSTSIFSNPLMIGGIALLGGVLIYKLTSKKKK